MARSGDFVSLFQPQAQSFALKSSPGAAILRGSDFEGQN